MKHANSSVPRRTQNETTPEQPIPNDKARKGCGKGSPSTQNGTRQPVPAARPPLRRRNADLRPREYLTEAEIERLVHAVRRRCRERRREVQQTRDEAMIVLAFRHGLRVSELCTLRWDQVDFDCGRLHVIRCKNGSPSAHPLAGVELRLLRRIHPENAPHRYVFLTKHGVPISPAGFRKMLARVAHKAGFGFGVHPHMLRHACGYALANAGHDTRLIQDYLGHKNIQHTVRYTALAAERFKALWPD